MPGFAYLVHELAVADLLVRIREAARSQGFEVLLAETQPDCWRPYTGPHRRPAWLKPDIRLTLGVGNHELHWFVEVDRATEHRPMLRRRINAYLTAWCDATEQATAGVFPRVLWVAPDLGRASVILEECSGAANAPGGLFVATPTLAAVEELARTP